MGYNRKAKAKVYLLTFDDEDMTGLEIRARSCTMNDLIEINRLQDEAGVVPIAKLAPMFIEALESWNLEDDAGLPVPQTLEALLDHDDDFVISVVNAWRDAIMGVSGPLGQTSSDGEPSLVASLPMEPLSESRAS